MFDMTSITRRRHPASDGGRSCLALRGARGKLVAPLIRPTAARSPISRASSRALSPHNRFVYRGWRSEATWPPCRDSAGPAPASDPPGAGADGARKCHQGCRSRVSRPLAGAPRVAFRAPHTPRRSTSRRSQEHLAPVAGAPRAAFRAPRAGRRTTSRRPQEHLAPVAGAHHAAFRAPRATSRSTSAPFQSTSLHFFHHRARPSPYLSAHS
jgi:hypothetical protein